MLVSDFTIIEEKDRIPYIQWDEIKMKMDIKMYERWCKVSRGSTAYIEGCYKHDLKKFLRLYDKENNI